MKNAAMRSSFVMSAAFLAAVAVFAQGPPQTDYAHMTMRVGKLADSFYTVAGMNGSGRTGGAIGILTGPDGIFMVDATFGPLAGKVVAAIKTFSNESIRFLVNTHPHGDHTGGNPNFAKMGTTILGRPEMRVDLMCTLRCNRVLLCACRGGRSQHIPREAPAPELTRFLEGQLQPELNQSAAWLRD